MNQLQYLIKYKLIVFVDEIHQIIGAGNAEGSGPDLAGSIKPILARDDVVFIGATTMDEYKRIFESDGALSRRFERVVIEEPKGKKLRDMIKGRVKTLSEFHNVSCTQEMLENVIVSATSFNDIANPDRTIDLIDKSMAIAKIDGDNTLKLKNIKKVYFFFTAWLGCLLPLRPIQKVIPLTFLKIRTTPMLLAV